MPKSTRVRETENPLGKKINAVMVEKGMAGDYAALARIFGVATPSTYDWITHGRLGKERYAKLVEWSGRGLDWWFDIAIEKPYGATEPSAGLVAREPTRLFPQSGKGKSPLSTPIEMLLTLTPAEAHEVDIFIAGILAGKRARKSNGSD